MEKEWKVGFKFKLRVTSPLCCGARERALDFSCDFMDTLLIGWTKRNSITAKVHKTGEKKKESHSSVIVAEFLPLHWKLL